MARVCKGDAIGHRGENCCDFIAGVCALDKPRQFSGFALSGTVGENVHTATTADVRDGDRARTGEGLARHARELQIKLGSCSTSGSCASCDNFMAATMQANDLSESGMEVVLRWVHRIG